MTNQREYLLEDLRQRKSGQVTLSEYREQFMTNPLKSLLEDSKKSEWALK